MATVVRYQCVAEAHISPDRSTGGVTIHEGKWAYCDAPDAQTPHQWAATGGITLEHLIRQRTLRITQTSPGALGQQ
jgi:hypothetical protein